MFVQYKAEQNMEPGYYESYEITVTEHQLLNRPEQPCEEAEDYDLLGCLKTNQARRVGCRPPWDIWSPNTIPLCQTMDQLDKYEKLDVGFTYVRQKKIFNEFGCKIPCSYKVCYMKAFNSKCSKTIKPGIQKSWRSCQRSRG